MIDLAAAGDEEILRARAWASLSREERSLALARPRSSRNAELSLAAAEILRAVRERGDAALLEFTERFDGARLQGSLFVSTDQIAAAERALAPKLRSSLETAFEQIRAFHEAQRPSPLRVETIPGVVCGRRHVPLERVGLYVPGGSAPLPSTLAMLAIPAMVAGCSEIVVATPPARDGSVHPTILAAASLLGARTILRCGGAQAIAALAYGTDSVPRVDKIFGPGNAWVTEAKMQVAFDPAGAAIDLPAGPSEVMVIADEEASPEFVAADLLAQAEHDPSSQTILAAMSEAFVRRVREQALRQLESLERRRIALQAMLFSRAFVARDPHEAMEIANAYAPEHLILQVRDASGLAAKARNAGSVFIGPWSPESVGDYASGTNHVLPTYGFARAYGGLSLESFMKTLTWQELSPQGLLALGPAVEAIARAEGLTGHERAVTLRLDALKRGEPVRGSR